MGARRRQQETGAGGDAGGGRRQDDFYANAEALFGLWDMQVREKNFKAAMVPARRLAELFPENPDVARFIAVRSQEKKGLSRLSRLE